MILLILGFYALAFYATISAIIYGFLSLFNTNPTAKLKIALSWPVWLVIGMIGIMSEKGSK